jgi:hypothetical protein
MLQSGDAVHIGLMEEGTTSEEAVNSMESIAKKLHNHVLTYEDKKSYSGGRFVSTPKTKMVQVQTKVIELDIEATCLSSIIHII